MMGSKKTFLALAAIFILLLFSALSSADLSPVCCCCSNPNLGIQMNYTSCDDTCDFAEIDIGSYSAGDTCSCEGCANTYTISGIVKKNGVAVQGATVEAGAVSNTSRSGGVFSLADVCEEESLISAQFGEDCSAEIDLPSAWPSNLADFIVNLNCACVNNTCYWDENAYCQGGEKITYDLSVASQNYNYCVQRCSADEDCKSNPCVNNDGSCLEECSATSSAANYDSDCACSTTSNGVCPVGCTKDNDVDCNFMNPHCGDYKVFYPYESCDKEPLLPGQFSFCSSESCKDCNCDSLSGCGNFVLEAGEACEIGMKCADGSDCTACVCGGVTCSGVLAAPSLSANYSAQIKSTLLKWTVDAKCAPAVMFYDVYKCNKVVNTSCASKTDFDLASGGAKLSKDKLNFTDIVQQNFNYCYFVRASYMDSTPASDSLIKCQSSGSYICMDRQGDKSEFCFNNKRSRCKADNNIDFFQDCASNRSFCMGPDREGITSCSALGVCDICNGLYGSYSNLDLTVHVQESTDVKYCMPKGSNGELVAGCYLDRTKTLFDAFRYCANVASCYDYKSKDACEYVASNPMSDPCGKNKGCEWVWMSDHELGGICRPNNKQIQNCRLCDDPKYNWITPICSPASCSLFGEACNYQGRNATITCSDTPTARCPQYKTEQACTGGTPVIVDAQYDANKTRISGTNAVTQKSKDLLNLGKCYWNTTCLRNADNLPVNFLQKTGYDCGNDIACEADFRDPVTTLLPSGSGIYSADVRIKFTVSDNYPLAQINTYFCIDNKKCYPNRLADKGEYRELRNASGLFSVYYYSSDPAKNLEVVKSTTIIVDVDPPIIELTEPSDAESFPTNQQDVMVKGLVATDAKFVCANNTATKKTVCVNNCALKQEIKKIPCFSETTGVFTMSINIGNSTGLNATRNIIFYSEDFAGNKYSNTLLGILYDVVPPSIPTIVIY